MSFVQDGDLETISARLDWMGINYYSSFVVRGLDEPAPAGARPTPWIGCEDVEIVPNGEPVTHMGWDVVPGGGTGFEVCTTVLGCKAGTIGGGRTFSTVTPVPPGRRDT